MNNVTILIIAALAIGYMTTTGVKSQWVRLGDILLLGPAMIYIGATQIKNGKYHDIFRVVLIFSGAATISYNLKNYMEKVDTL